MWQTIEQSDVSIINVTIGRKSRMIKLPYFGLEIPLHALDTMAAVLEIAVPR
jgi:hypothetical protein